MTKPEYQDYLSTTHWIRVSSDYRSRNPHCERCGLMNHDAQWLYGQRNNVHHRDGQAYDNLWNESDYDLETLCSRCHEIEHFGYSDRPNWGQAAICLNPWNRRN